MRSMTVRFSEEQYEELQVQALIEDRPMVQIIRAGVQVYMDERLSALGQVKQAIAQARSREPVSPERALRMAERAAELDDSEGLGEVRVVRRRATGSRRAPRKKTAKASGS